MDVSDKIHESHGAGCHSVGVLEQRGRGGCSGDSGPATHGAAEQVARSLTSSRESEAQTRDTRVVATALNPLALCLNT